MAILWGCLDIESNSLPRLGFQGDGSIEIARDCFHMRFLKITIRQGDERVIAGFKPVLWRRTVEAIKQTGLVVGVPARSQ
jgi:hypothetical protein